MTLAWNAQALALGEQRQRHRQRGPKLYSLHAPEVECIGKGKARADHLKTRRPEFFTDDSPKTDERMPRRAME